LWEGLRKKLRDPNKRENEFQALCRNEVTVDFWTELIQSGAFHRRFESYQKAMGQFERFKARETRFEGIASEYFQLYDKPSEKNVLSVMEMVRA
jgi:hypothetical protein